MGFGKDPHDSCDENELKEACKAVGYAYDPHKLFKCLQSVPGRVLLTIWDLDCLCSRKRQRGDVPHVESSPKSPTAHPGRQKRHFGEAQTLGTSASTPAMSTLVLKGTTARQQLITSLKQKHGSTVAAWRRAMDPKMTGQVQFGKFMLVLEDCAFHGNVKGLWQELCNDRPAVTFKDVDQDSAKILDRFRKFLVNKYGNLVTAWDQGIDHDGVGRVDKNEFTKAYQTMEIPARNCPNSCLTRLYLL